MKPRAAYVAFIACLISLVLLYSFIFPSVQAIAQNQNSILLKYEVNSVFVGILRHIISFENPTSHKVMGGKLFVPLIRNETARHYAILYNISSSMGRLAILSDDSGNKYAYWSNIIIDGKQTFTVELDYYVLSFSTHYSINSSMIAEYDKSSDLYMKYTQPEELIQSDNSEILSKAQNLTNGESDVHEKVSQIYNFVDKHLSYAIQKDERGALWALKNRTGDCSEYSYLFVALCRAAGIPARIQAGFAFHSIKETLQEGHMWAEYYLENYGWIPVDATWQLFDTMDYRHFSSIQSIPEIMPYANYVFNYTTGPDFLDEEQNVFLKSSSTNAFGEIFTEKIVKTVQKANQAKFALFLARVFGATVIFSSELAKAEQTFLRSEIKMQNAIESWEANQQLAHSNVDEALRSAEEATRDAWALIAEEFTLLIGIPIVIMLIALVLLKRHQTK